jgi:hypothetical protein
MSAADLRQAAETLRERAAAATPGPWESHLSKHPDLGGDVVRVTDLGCSCDYSCNRTDPPYIATMHPGVGLALAAWLDDEAKAVAAYHANKATPFALDLARLINGSQG